jgi:hypothetical protein
VEVVVDRDPQSFGYLDYALKKKIAASLTLENVLFITDIKGLDKAES